MKPPPSAQLHRRDFLLRVGLAISTIVVITNLTTAVFFGLRFNALSNEQRQAIARAIAEGRSPESAIAPSPLLLAPFSLVVPVSLGLLLAWVFSLRLARPIETINRAAADLSAGKLDTRIDLKGQFGELSLVANTLNQVAESLERLEGERRQMIADIAHELRNPLTALRTRLEGLEDGYVQFSPKEAERLQAQVTLLSRLVEDLRTLSLADAGQLSLHLRQFDLQDWLEAILEQVQPRAKEKNITLGFLPPAYTLPPPALPADPDRLSQVLHNLLDNALRHTPEGGNIQVGLEYTPNQVRLWVQDSGPGIPEESLPKVFNRFYRADASRSRSSGGSGLGLAMVKSITELHGGSVEASNSLQGGAVFSCRFPIRST